MEPSPESRQAYQALKLLVTHKTTCTDIAMRGVFPFNAICSRRSESLTREAVPAHAHDLAPLRHDEEDADVRVFEDVEKRVRTLVAEPVGYRQRLLVKNFHKARGIALGRDIH